MRLEPCAVQDGKITLTAEHDGAEGVIVVEVFEEDGAMCLGIYQLVAEIALPPKKWLRLVRECMAELMTWARASGCTEIRFCGRDWSRVFPDFEPLSGFRNGMRKAL